MTNPFPGSVDEYFQSDGDTAADSLQPGESPLEHSLTGAGIIADDNADNQGDRAKILQDLAPIPNGGALLEQRNARKILKAIEKGLDSQERLRKNREEEGKHWDLVSDGCQFSILEKSEDRSIYKQLFPPGVDETPLPIPNKVADLQRKIISQVLVDKFLPDPKPDGANSDRNRGAADLLKKLLRKNASATELNEAEMLRECLELNMAWKSAFVYQWVDPMGGGWRPMQKLAHPQATDANNPMVGPKLGPDGQPIIVNGQPITERSTDPILRYVAESGDAGETGKKAYTFTRDPAAAARQWMPRHMRRVIRPTQVALFPVTANALNARSLTVIMWETLGEAKDRFPILTTLDKEQLKNACTWRPKRWKSVVPEAVRPKGASVTMGADGDVLDDNLFFWYHHWCRISGAYQDGAELAITGGNTGANNALLLRRDTLREDVELEDGTTVPVLMDPPIVQFKGYNDTKGGDSFGRAPLSEFGGSYELYAHVYTGLIEFLDKGLHPNVYIPSTSPVSRQDYMRRDGTPIDILVPEDKPFIETTPQPPAFVMPLIDKLDMGMNSAAGTNETSNGLDSAYSESGIAKDVAIRQAKVSLMQLWENTAAGMMQFWKIETQLSQGKLTVPQEVLVSGTESAFKQKWFVGADLIGVGRTIPIASGSGTMQSPMEKVQLLSAMVNGKFIDVDKAGEVARASMADDLGLPSDVHEERVDRQIGAWIDGPPPDWLEQHAQNQTAQQNYQTAIQQRVAVLTQSGLDPQSAQAQATQAIPQPQITPLEDPFEPRPNDDEPGVAKVRALKLSNLIDSPDYEAHEAPWRALVDQAYAKAFAAAGGQTVAQAAAAAQAQRQAAQTGLADASYQQFFQDVQRAVMGDIKKAIAKTAAGDAMSGGGSAEGSASDPVAATIAGQADVAARAHEANTTAATTTANAQADRVHEAQQNLLERTHQSQENALDRGAEQRANLFKSALDAHTKTQMAAARERTQSLAREAVPSQPS